MKRQAFSLISLLSLLLVAGSAIAQTVHVRANIPFNFGVGSKTFPAGTYDVRPIDHHDNKILLLKARDGHASMMVLSNVAENLKPADKTKLVFNQYRNQYFLSEIWVNGATRRFRTSRLRNAQQWHPAGRRRACPSRARASQGRVAVLASGDVSVVLADIFGEPIEGFWMDVGRPEDLIEANLIVIRREGHKLQGSSGATLLQGKRLRLAPGVRISGAVLLGDVVRVGDDVQPLQDRLLAAT